MRVKRFNRWWSYVTITIHSDRDKRYTVLLTRELQYGITVENYRFVRGRDDPSEIPFPAIKYQPLHIF